MSNAIILEPATVEAILTKLDQLQQEVHRLRESVDVDQNWYWSGGWQTMEQEVDTELANGDYQEFDTAEDLIANLHASV